MNKKFKLLLCATLPPIIACTLTIFYINSSYNKKNQVQAKKVLENKKQMQDTKAFSLLCDEYISIRKEMCEIYMKYPPIHTSSEYLDDGSIVEYSEFSPDRQEETKKLEERLKSVIEKINAYK